MSITTTKKLIKGGDPNDVDDSPQIKNQLDKALEENKKVRKLIDLFILALFLVFIMFSLS